MKVMKFGGTSLGSVYGLMEVKRIIESQQENVIVVVSALNGVTDALIEIAKKAAAGDLSYVNDFDDVAERHKDIAKGVLKDPMKQVDLLIGIEQFMEELVNLLKGVSLIRDLSDRNLAVIISYGEMLSSTLLANAVEETQLFDAKRFIKTEKKYARHVIVNQLTNSLIGAAFGELPKISVVPGFIASDVLSGEVTNLGRGGSDYTASVIAAALNASVLEIWTDVDGFMTADPRVISAAYPIAELSYVEAMELCNFGAKVVYPPTIYPVFHKGIPIVIKNTFNKAAQGTLISNKTHAGGKAIKGISSINDTSLITVQGLGMVGVIGVNYRIFKTLAKNGISVFFVSQASSENSTSIGVCNQDADLACKVLNEEFAKEIEMGEVGRVSAEYNLATVAIVGENMKHTPGIAGKLFGTLGRTGINVIACAQGASETNISFVVDGASLRKTLNVIHDFFFLSEYKVLNLFVCGIGTVGGSLLEQIEHQREKLMEERGLKLNVVGIANGHNVLFDSEGIDLSAYRKKLSSGEVSSIECIRDGVIRMNIFNSVFVDCTANEKVASLYQEFLQHNISVVTANKIAASSSYGEYRALKDTARSRGVKFLFETNVGAGLPIINTINDLINSGDKILKIEAVLSGTLNYIFNKIGADVPFSETVHMAKEEGFSEPDPRIDLCGKDVIRKLVILAREAGHKLEQDEVERTLFVPEALLNGTLDDFWSGLPTLDASFEDRRQVLEKEGKRWRFVAQFADGKASVGLREVDAGHHFFNLDGSNNIILLTTERYRNHPMLIQGYGAGADVAAAGVFADIMSIANI